jgi:hypothetical protein
MNKLLVGLFTGALWFTFYALISASQRDWVSETIATTQRHKAERAAQEKADDARLKYILEHCPQSFALGKNVDGCKEPR